MTSLGPIKPYGHKVSFFAQSKAKFKSFSAAACGQGEDAAGDLFEDEEEEDDDDDDMRGI